MAGDCVVTIHEEHSGDDVYRQEKIMKLLSCMSMGQNRQFLSTDNNRNNIMHYYNGCMSIDRNRLL